MGLPIALGIKCCSSLVVEAISYKDEEYHVHSHFSAPLVAFAYSPCKQLQALIQISYYCIASSDNITSTSARVIADISITISPSTEPFSTHYRKAHHRITLSSDNNANSAGKGDAETVSSVVPNTHLEACFSADAKFLTCMIPCPPDVIDSVVAVFPLVSPREDILRVRRLPSLPTYIQQKSTPTTIPLAAQPSVIRLDTPSVHISSFCDFSFVNMGILAVGCSNGSIAAISYSPIAFLGTIYKENDTLATATSWLQSLQACDSVISDAMGKTMVALDAKRRVHVFNVRASIIEALSNGKSHTNGDSTESSSFYESTLKLKQSATSTSPTLLHLRVRQGPIIQEDFECTKLLSSSLLATIKVQNSAVDVSVWNIAHLDTATPMMTYRATANDLCEHAQSRYSCATIPPFSTPQMSYLDNDAASDCLAVSSVIKISDKNSENDDLVQVQSFSCIWNWRHNVDAIKLLQLNYSADTDAVFSRLYFAKTAENDQKICHIYSSKQSEMPTFIKEVLNIGLLSFPYESHPSISALRPANILVTPQSIVLPKLRNTNCNSQLSIEWNEVKLPPSYINRQGCPVLVAVGQRYSQSVAIAGEKGLCIYHHKTFQHKCETKAPLVSKVQTRSLFKHGKWHNFGNEADESAFRVVAFTWWEGVCDNASVTNRELVDDLLLTVIERVQDGVKTKYFSCWSHNNLDHDHQLMRTSGQVHCEWGVALPTKLSGELRIDILPQPQDKSSMNTSTRKAVVAIYNQSALTDYSIYCIQLVSAEFKLFEALQDLRQYDVLCQMVHSDCIGYNCLLFLAGASYHFNLNKDHAPDESVFVTLGVMRSIGGFDAISITRSGAVAFNQLERNATVSSLLLSDHVASTVAGTETSNYIWLVQFVDGRFMSWSVPFALTKVHAKSLLRNSTMQSNKFNSLDSFGSPMRKVSAVLGNACFSSSGSTWMQESCTSTRHSIALGPLPFSFYGCVLMSGQKSYTSLIDNSASTSTYRAGSSTTIWGVNDIELSPPVRTSAVNFILMNTNWIASASELDKEMAIAHHLLHNPISIKMDDSTISILRILCLKWTEKVARLSAASSSGSSYEQSQLLLSQIIGVIKLSLTKYAVTNFFINLARQIEPSCYRHLIPLPQCSADDGEESLEDLISRSLTLGSLKLSATTLPLFSRYKSTQQFCLSLFAHCFNKVEARLATEDRIYRSCRFEVEMMSDLFWYGSRLDRLVETDNHDNVSKSEEADDEDTDEDEPSSTVSHSSVYDEIDDNSVEETNGYSITCGVFKMFRGSTKQTALPNIESNGLGVTRYPLPGYTTLDNESTDSDMHTHGTQQYVTTYLTSHLLSPSVDDQNQWSIAALMAEMILAGNNGSTSTSNVVFTSYITNFALYDIQSLSQDDNTASDSAESYLANLMLRCQIAIVDKQASVLLDLLLILIVNIDVGEQPSLCLKMVLLCIIVAHAANRINELRDDQIESDIWNIYDKSCRHC